jgi:uncharacterized protein
VGEPFYSLNQYLQEQYGEKVYKLALNGGMTCPNRDGTLGTRGCLFCSAGGSGEFAVPVCLKGNTEAVPPHSVEQQIEAAKQRLSGKQVGNKFIAYFQAYTNTYAPVEYLRALYLPVLMREDIVGLSIATRPDCLPEDVLDLLEELNQIKPVWVELGLQTIHEETARYIRRGYELSCFEQAVAELGKRNLEVIVHLIFGLPGESKDDMLASVRYLNEVGSTHSLLQEQEAYGKIKGVKFQLLHVLKDTDLAELYLKTDFKTLTMEEYIDILCDAISYLSPDIVVHRLTGDGPKKLLIAPKWSEDKKRVLNAIHKELAERGITQGCKIREYQNAKS